MVNIQKILKKNYKNTIKESHQATKKKKGTENNYKNSQKL